MAEPKKPSTTEQPDFIPADQDFVPAGAPGGAAMTEQKTPSNPLGSPYRNESPSGPKSLLGQAWNATNRFVNSAGDAALTTLNPMTYYHMATDPADPTSERMGPKEAAGVNEMNPVSRLGYRMVNPIANALIDYGKGRVHASDVLEVLPEALGQGVGTVGAMELTGRAPGLVSKVPVARQGLWTLGKTAENFDVMKPLKTFGNVPKYWRESSPEGMELARMARANREARIRQTYARNNPPAPEPQAAALGRPTVSGDPSSVLGRVPVMRDPYANLDAIRARINAVPRESWGMEELPPTDLPQAEVLGRLGQTAGERTALRNFYTSNPSALGRLPGPRPSASESVLSEEPNPKIHGTLARGKGRMVLTPEEALQREQLYKLAQKQAHERGMQFAGGQVPPEGRTVPYRPRPNVTEEWRGKKPESE